MNYDDIPFLSIQELAKKYKTGELSPVEVVKSSLERIKKLNVRLKALVTVADESTVLAKANNAEKDFKAGVAKSPIEGVPIVIKDDEYTADFPTTASSPMFADFRPAYDATFVRKLKEAGAIILGKANLHEFGFGVTSHPTRNPWNLNKIPGGSSGGSCAAVAAGMAYAASGSDAGGSVRIPSSLCGTTGIKPTVSRVSRYGLMVICWSMEDIGPITRYAYDAAMMLNIMAGPDPNDPTTLSAPPVPDYTRELNGDIKGLRVGIPRNFLETPTHEDVQKNFWQAVDKLEEEGAIVEEVTLPHLKQLLAAWYLVWVSEVSTIHLDLLRTRKAEYGDDVRPLAEVGFPVLAVDYLKAQRARRFLIEAIDSEVFSKVDVMISPTTPIPASDIGPAGGGNVNIAGSLVPTWDALVSMCGPFNISGHPAMSIPSGFTKDGLPTSLQIIGRDFEESTVFRVGQAYQKVTDWHKRRPPL